MFQQPGRRIIEPSIGDILLHKKGKYYRVITYAKHSETDETMVVYEDLETNGVWTRPMSMFTTDRFAIAITAEQLNS